MEFGWALLLGVGSDMLGQIVYLEVQGVVSGVISSLIWIISVVALRITLLNF